MTTKKEAQSYRTQIAARVLQAADAQGHAWDVEITAVGVAKSKRLEWPAEVLSRDAQMFDGVPSYVDHQSFEDMKAGKGRSVQDLIGWVRNPRMGEGALIGTLNLLEPEKWAGKLRAIQEAPPGIGGMSLDVAYKASPSKGVSIGRVTQVVHVFSVDLVSCPDAGGRILRAVAGREGWTEEFNVGPAAEHEDTAGGKQAGGVKMKQIIERILQAIKRFDPSKAEPMEAEFAGVDWNDKTKVDDLHERVTQALAVCKPPEPAQAAAVVATPGLSAADRQIIDDAKASGEATRQAIQQANVIRCEAVLTKALANSKLPVPLCDELEQRYKGKEFKDEDLQADITRIRQTFARMVPEQRVVDPTVRITMQEEDKLQIAMDKMFGLTHQLVMETDSKGFQRVKQGAPLPSEIPALRSLRSAYVAYTGDPDVTGESKISRISQIFNVAGFPYALASTLNRALLKEYNEVNFHWQDIVTRVSNATDFRNQERIRTGYFGDLDTVLDDGEYEEIAAVTDERIQFGVGTKGNKLTVTRRTIINDDLNFVQAKVRLLGRSAARTLAKFVWGFALDNATYDADATAWFIAGHGNFGTTAMSATIATQVGLMNTIDLGFFNQTEKDSGEKLELSGPYLLVVPKALHATAIAFNQAQYADASFTPNPWYHAFGVNNERIFATGLFGAEITDWLVFDVSGNVDILEVAFLQGRQMPEFFLADQPTVGQMFTQDRLVWKIRHEYGGDILDYRGAWKMVVSN